MIGSRRRGGRRAPSFERRRTSRLAVLLAVVAVSVAAPCFFALPSPGSWFGDAPHDRNAPRGTVHSLGAAKVLPIAARRLPRERANVAPLMVLCAAVAGCWLKAKRDKNAAPAKFRVVLSSSSSYSNVGQGAPIAAFTSDTGSQRGASSSDLPVHALPAMPQAIAGDELKLSRGTLEPSLANVPCNPSMVLNREDIARHGCNSTFLRGSSQVAGSVATPELGSDALTQHQRRFRRRARLVGGVRHTQHRGRRGQHKQRREASQRARILRRRVGSRLSSCALSSTILEPSFEPSRMRAAMQKGFQVRARRNFDRMRELTPATMPAHEVPEEEEEE